MVLDPATGVKDRRQGFWIHVDRALGAMVMPFLEKACEQGRFSQRGPLFDFRFPEVSSIAASGHKWIGAPIPTGLYMTRVKYQLRPPSDPAYIGSPDTTLAGSEAAWPRSCCGPSWPTIPMKPRSSGPCPLALAVLFRQPNQAIVRKYSLSCERVAVAGGVRDYGHVYLMEHVGQGLINALIQDLSQPGAFPELLSERAAESTPQQVADDLLTAPPPSPSGARPISHVPTKGRGWH